MIQASSDLELLDILTRTDITVPKRTEGRTKLHTEKYAVFYLLSTLLKENQLAFPLHLRKSERPDFVLSMAGTRIGIEHTEAVAQDVAQTDALIEQGNGRRATLIQRNLPDEKKKRYRDIIEQLETSQIDEGWIGDSVENDWAIAMFYFAQKKEVVANKDGFKLYPANWLLIYDNWRLPKVDLSTATRILSDCLAESDVFKTFSTIYIISEKHLCELRDGHAYLYRLNELWNNVEL